MPAIFAVLDACVLFPASLRDTLLRAAQNGLYEMRFSVAILEEVRRNLVETHKSDEIKAQKLIEAIVIAFPGAMVKDYEHLIDTMTNHPKDRHVLAAAVMAKAQIIVTANLRDFPARSLEPFNIQAQSPDVFLMTLWNEDPEAMMEILSTQANELRRPPLTLDQILVYLALQAPIFVQQVQAYRALQIKDRE